jgi:hypothetical protein
MKKVKFSKEDRESIAKSLSLFNNDRLKSVVEVSGAAGAIGASFSRSTWERINEN